MSRFNLDPRAPGRSQEPAAPPRPAAPASSPPPSVRPPPAPLPTPRRPAFSAAPTHRRNLMIALAIAGILLVAGAGAAVWFVLLQSYPEKYLVKESETPAGMRIATLSADELDALAIEKNPGEIDQAELEDRFSTSDGRQPKEGWGEVLQAGGNRVALFALLYQSEDDARDAGRTLATICGFANGAVLRDGEVLVVLVPEGASRANVLAIVDVLRDKASGLKPVCGTA